MIFRKLRLAFLLLLGLFLVGCTVIPVDQGKDPNPGDETFDPDDDYDKLTLDEIKAIIKAKIPEIAPEKLYLPIGIKDSSASISWRSDSEQIDIISGEVTKGAKDTVVILTAYIRFHDQTYVMDIPITVKGVELRPLKTKNVISGYFFDSKYFAISDEMASQIDVINYSFATIDKTTHKLNLNGLYHLSEVLALREKGIRVTLAIGGWGADGFSQGVRTKEARETLINSIMETLRKHQFDGIDLDWEYPTSTVAGIAAHPSDKANLTLFVQELRQAMDSYRDDLLLTIAVIGGSSASSFYDIPGLVPYIDFFNIMTYDGGTGTVANHHTNLRPTAKQNTSVVSAANVYLSLGVPKEKIVIGGAFYGHRKTFTTVFDGILYSPTTPSGSLDYTTIKNTVLTDPSYQYYFDEEAQAPYLSNGTYFISYDDPVSIALKAQYAKDNSFGGMMFWELGSDKSGELLNAIYQVFKD